MKWIKASDRLPETSKKVCIKLFGTTPGVGQSHGTFFVDDHRGAITNSEVEWLDESEPTPEVDNDGDFDLHVTPPFIKTTIKTTIKTNLPTPEVGKTMTTNEIPEGNKLIAEFMGLPCPPIYDDYSDDGENPTGRGFYDAGELKYHSSWDWLMQVKTKIDNMDNYEYDVIIWRADCHINNRQEILFESSILDKRDTLINIVWGCIVQFIQWYNSQQ
jgi:hypothetical protein